jgi:hypothetical protein
VIPDDDHRTAVTALELMSKGNAAGAYCPLKGGSPSHAFKPRDFQIVANNLKEAWPLSRHEYTLLKIALVTVSSQVLPADQLEGDMDAIRDLIGRMP